MDTFSETFGSEWDALSVDDRHLVVEDYSYAQSTYGDTLADYRRNIGPGNLGSYVACLRISQGAR